jgi:cbb3-type cytochrome oxidase maturation protein
MNAVLFLLPIATLLAAVFVVIFVVAVKRGQFDDLDDPAERILHDDD